MTTDDSKVTDRTAVRGSSGRELGLQAEQEMRRIRVQMIAAVNAREVQALDYHRALRSLAEMQDRAEQAEDALAVSEGIRQQVEQEIREMWWLGHGCTTALYGDDGEMQCGMHLLDFKRMPLDELRTRVQEMKRQQIAEVLKNEIPRDQARIDGLPKLPQHSDLRDGQPGRSEDSAGKER